MPYGAYIIEDDDDFKSNDFNPIAFAAPQPVAAGHAVTCALPDLRYVFYAAVGTLTVICALWLALLRRR